DAWSATELEVTMQAGSVLVRGPLAPDGIALKAGQQLRANPSSGELYVSNTVQSHASSDASAVPSVAPVDPRAPAVASAIASSTPAQPSDAVLAVPWTKRVAAGEYRIVLDEAERRGLHPCLAQCSLADIAALPDAA